LDYTKKSLSPKISYEQHRRLDILLEEDKYAEEENEGLFQNDTFYK
jgi:hypothetical protein